MFARVERLVAAGKVLFCDRAAQGTTWRDEGHRSAASWMAEKTGTGVGDALNALETSSALASLPETTDALRRGELSAPQLKIIAGAAAEQPPDRNRAAESGRRITASRGSRNAPPRSGPRPARPSRRTPATGPSTQARYVRHWADPDGAFRLDAKLTPDDGAKLLCALKDESDFRFDAARKAEAHESPAAYRADALVALVTGEPAAPLPKTPASAGQHGHRSGHRGHPGRRQRPAPGIRRSGRDVCHPRGGPGPRGRRARASSPTPSSRSSCTTARTSITVCHVGEDHLRPCPERPRRARPGVRGPQVRRGLRAREPSLGRGLRREQDDQPGRVGPGVSVGTTASSPTRNGSSPEATGRGNGENRPGERRGSRPASRFPRHELRFRRGRRTACADVASSRDRVSLRRSRPPGHRPDRSHPRRAMCRSRPAAGRLDLVGDLVGLHLVEGLALVDRRPRRRPTSRPGRPRSSPCRSSGVAAARGGGPQPS